MLEKMKMSKRDVNCIRLGRVFRMPTRKPLSKPRLIITKFSFFKDKEFVWSHVKNLKGTRIGIQRLPKRNRRYPREIIPGSVLNKAKQDNHSVYFKNSLQTAMSI